MTENVYSGLMAKLLVYGDVRKKPFRLEDEYDYLVDGFGESHVPDLVRILEDDELADSDPEQPEVWAQTHAWRILGILRAADAIVPLLNLLRYIDERDDDWVQDEVPTILAHIGPAVLQPAADFSADAENGIWARVGAISAIEEIGKEYPESRAQCVQIVSQQLEQFAEQDEILNAALIDCLTELKAVEAAPLIERAFASGTVDVTLRGDWEDVQIYLGLLDERTSPKRNFLREKLFGLFGSDELSDDDEGDEEEGDEDEEDEEDEEDGENVDAPRMIQKSAPDRRKQKRKRKEAQKQRRTQQKRKKK